MSWYRTTIAAAAVATAAALPFVVSSTPATAATSAPLPTSADQTVTVERPTGQITVSDLTISNEGRLQLTVTDTRDRDPGWSVTVSVTPANPEIRLGWKPSVQHYTPAFRDGDGVGYAQEVDAGPAVSAGHGSSGIEGVVLGSASRGHGLGIAVLDANLSAIGRVGGQQGLAGATVTVTIV